jgi:hypothetical protein
MTFEGVEFANRGRISELLHQIGENAKHTRDVRGLEYSERWSADVPTKHF